MYTQSEFENIAEDALKEAGEDEPLCTDDRDGFQMLLRCFADGLETQYERGLEDGKRIATPTPEA